MTIQYEAIRNFLYAEARSLDDKEWDKWLTFYHPEVDFWMPSWDDDGELVTDPQREVSLMYYAHKGGLEDRIFRIKTERSSASSLPEARTSHILGNIEVIQSTEQSADVRYNWSTNSYRYKTVDTYFGTTFVTLVKNAEGQMLIKRKKIILVNDYIHHVIDIYHV
ncbi:benzoate 1,2-dioxygenase small subunit [Marinomonas sp. IMCC 4694]|uniref:benzoate 1,2-dioxygenase small subunit n=1 Tax=Marinomonas sp. IMCC 4694 TaxID=2605432 RepID=UPI0011E64577|nr:benzoate 1,2-dioxygenase small subunit [Marinomonas sp. IMCC 4694]TYL46911.1 benzoate 1,2-dioxygenase small subunit [Marinomonas sp. IMCC 4694]